MRLDLDQYMALPREDRQRIDAWCIAHGIDPTATYALTLDGETVTAEQYAHPIRCTPDGNDVERTQLTGRITTPFPKVAAWL